MRTRQGDKRKDILTAATRIFALDGYERAKISTIASEAGVATGSVYLYFKGKEDILDAIFAAFWEHLLHGMETLATQAPMERMKSQLGLFFDRLAENLPLASIYLRDHHRFVARKPQGYEHFQACLEKGKRAFRDATAVAMEEQLLQLTHAQLFGGVRAALEVALYESSLDKTRIRSHMLSMAMGSIAVLIQENPCE
jgi:AcrR family transcriptional regulator